MIFVSLHLDAGTRLDSQRLDSGDILIMVSPLVSEHHTTLVLTPAGAEHLYDFLGGVLAGLRFDALEQAERTAADASITV